MGRRSRFSPEVRERAVRLVLETEGEHDSLRFRPGQPCPNELSQEIGGRGTRALRRLPRTKTGGLPRGTRPPLIPQ